MPNNHIAVACYGLAAQSIDQPMDAWLKCVSCHSYYITLPVENSCFIPSYLAHVLDCVSAINMNILSSLLQFMVAYELLVAIGINVMLSVDGSQFSVVQVSLHNCLSCCLQLRLPCCLCLCFHLLYCRHLEQCDTALTFVCVFCERDLVPIGCSCWT